MNLNVSRLFYVKRIQNTLESRFYRGCLCYPVGLECDLPSVLRKFTLTTSFRCWREEKEGDGVMGPHGEKDGDENRKSVYDILLVMDDNIQPIFLNRYFIYF